MLGHFKLVNTIPFCMGTWGTFHPQRILHAPCAISVHGDVSPGEPQTQDLRSGAECSPDLSTAELKYQQ